MYQKDILKKFFYPLFRYTDKDKAEYNKFCHIKNSALYSQFGMHRTGCWGCPFALEKSLSKELKVLQQHEPDMYKAVTNIFRNAYTYSAKYRTFAKKQKAIKSNQYHQITIDELIH